LPYLLILFFMNRHPLFVVTAMLVIFGVLSAHAQTTRRARTQAPTTTTTSTNTTVTVISNN